MIVAALRPDSWSLPLFVHLLGAIALFGGVAAMVIVGLARGEEPGRAALLARVAFRTFLFVVLPGWIAMRAGAQWILDKEDAKGGWVDVGFIVSEPGLVVVLLPLGILSWLSARRSGTGRLALAVPALASIYLAALAVAWWAMTAKPGT